jgi:protein-arginine kinase activator protein McsA
MKSYIVNLEGRTEIRTIDELKQLLEYMIENENYEQCSVIKYAIDNYDELYNKYNLIKNAI